MFRGMNKIPRSWSTLYKLTYFRIDCLFESIDNLILNVWNFNNSLALKLYLAVLCNLFYTERLGSPNSWLSCVNLWVCILYLILMYSYLYTYLIEYYF